jgi:hypothetical protein
MRLRGPSPISPEAIGGTLVLEGEFTMADSLRGAA